MSGVPPTDAQASAQTIREALLSLQRAELGSQRTLLLTREDAVALRAALAVVEAEHDQLRQALERLASSEGFEGAGWIGGESFPERELRARGRFAEAALAALSRVGETTAADEGAE